MHPHIYESSRLKYYVYTYYHKDTYRSFMKNARFTPPEDSSRLEWNPSQSGLKYIYKSLYEWNSWEVSSVPSGLPCVLMAGLGRGSREINQRISIKGFTPARRAKGTIISYLSSVLDPNSRKRSPISEETKRAACWLLMSEALLVLAGYFISQRVADILRVW